MVVFWNVLCWILSFLFAFIAAAMFGMGGKLQAFLLLCIVILLLPPVQMLIFRISGKSIPWWWRGLLIIVLWAGVMLSLVLNPATSIYKSPEYETQFMNMYEAKLKEWPLPYESIFVDTKYGKVHVIESGVKDGPPLLLLHASAITGWSWIPNIEALGSKYHIYAPDNIGEVGRSVLNDVNITLQGGQAISEFYTELTQKLEFNESYVAGASVGGFMATNYALYASERVKKLVLLGSMGYGDTNKTLIGITLAQAFPLKSVQNQAFNWSFGDSPQVRSRFEEWFRLVLNGSMPKPTMPKSFTPEQLQQIKIPVLAYFGTKDGVIGNADNARKLAENIPDVTIKIVESGHVIGAELPEVVNPSILDFFGN